MIHDFGDYRLLMISGSGGRIIVSLGDVITVIRFSERRKL